ncbi:MAG: DUF3047 domain-containing protein [Candidatus Omnitrophota bacterium]
MATLKKTIMIVSGILIPFVAAAIAAFPAWGFTEPQVSPSVEPAAVAVKKDFTAWREDFGDASITAGDDVMPGWKRKKKPGTKAAVFSLAREVEGGSYLHMEADKASASLVAVINGVDLNKTPFLRWRWRVTELPRGADGRIKAADDQAIGIYLGSGSLLKNKSVSYRWDTETPRGAHGKCAYGGGTIKVKWYTLRNKEDAADGQWYIEERNAAEDFKNAWGFYPDKMYLSVSCNSQYTGSTAAADLDWIEFSSSPAE